MKRKVRNEQKKKHHNKYEGTESLRNKLAQAADAAGVPVTAVQGFIKNNDKGKGLTGAQRRSIVRSIGRGDRFKDVCEQARLQL